MALGTNHGYYKKQDRSIKLRLRAHQKIMKYYMEVHNWDKHNASSVAFKIIAGLSDKALNELILEYEEKL